ncbi:MAG: enoyl-CoA hydratase/isomerase family protein [Gammaproteobacteria bacterium]|nr:enoyl-CoA hydratase/isomerase family protein [Gammaproteobacteria bacterium]
MANSILQELDQDGVLTLTLNKPERRNAFDDAQVATLTGRLLKADRDASVRVIILTGSSDTFCSGGDIGWMKKTAGLDVAQNYEDALRLAELMSVLNSIGKPTIARINGDAYGGGVGLIACCDIAVAVDNANFALSEVRLGLVPAVISPYVIAALGVQQSRRYMLTGEKFNAAHAVKLGLIHEAVEANELDHQVRHIVAQLLKGGPEALRESKELMAMVSHTDRSSNQTITRRTAEIIAQIRVSPEGQEGLGAFLEKRKPSWDH